ncbi:MAG: DNA polymerase III subunit delta' [Clostridiaceae bacterium]|nr:DNA polymerase III subunit delta' [Clostridiaceae bacterium]
MSGSPGVNSFNSLNSFNSVNNPNNAGISVVTGFNGFNNIVGQKEVIGRLKNSLKRDMVRHAYIFSGPRGIGKKTVAKAFAGMLLCSNPGENGGCGKCLPCRLFLENTNPDFCVIERNEASIAVDDIRNMQNDIAIRPLYSNRKVYLVADGEKMTVQAQNCLLKTLEEPPGYGVIIITTSNYDALLHTVCSRCVKYAFVRNTDEEVRLVLGSRTGLRGEELDFIVQYADGVIGKALDVAASGEFMSLREKVVDVILQLPGEGLKKFFEICTFFMENKDNIDKILDIMLLTYRDIFISLFRRKEKMPDFADLKLDFTSSKLHFTGLKDKTKNKISDAAVSFSPGKLVANMETIEYTRRCIKRNANFQLAIETMIIKLQEG